MDSDSLTQHEDRGTKSTTEDSLRAFRIERFQELGFSDTQSLVLCDTPGHQLRRVDYHYVRRIMNGLQDQGYTVEDAAVMVLRIVT